tara:strand:+ start:153 stop:326 length:174 start_codon:yes stop_codon:yes gene_type:complete
MKPEDYLLLIGELEGCSAHLKKLGQAADLEVIKEMVSKYYKLYYKCRKAYEQESKCD